MVGGKVHFRYIRYIRSLYQRYTVHERAVVFQVNFFFLHSECDVYLAFLSKKIWYLRTLRSVSGFVFVSRNVIKVISMRGAQVSSYKLCFCGVFCNDVGKKKKKARRLSTQQKNDKNPPFLRSTLSPLHFRFRRVFFEKFFFVENSVNKIPPSLFF